MMKSGILYNGRTSISGKVGGDCKVPAGIYAVPFLGHIEAVAFIGSPDGKEMYKRSLNGQTQDAKQLGESLAEALIADGAAAF